MINAYLQPVMQHYLENLETRLAASKPRVAAGASPAQVSATSHGGSLRSGEETGWKIGAALQRCRCRITVEERPFRAAKLPEKGRAGCSL